MLIQGFRIVTGRSRDSMAALATNMARAALIVTVATSMAMFGKDLQSFLTQDVQDEITYVVTGKDDTAEELIDRNLGYMQLALTSVSVLDVAGDVTLDSAKTRAMWFIGLGTGGPAVTAGAMLLLYQVAMAMFIGFGPLFILCLLFEQTKSLFQRWLFYGIGTMFSMAVLAAMTGIAMEMVARVAASFWGTFMAYSQIGGSAGSASPGPQGQPPGSSGSGGGAVFMPPVPVNSVGGSTRGRLGPSLVASLIPARAPANVVWQTTNEVEVRYVHSLDALGPHFIGVLRGLFGACRGSLPAGDVSHWWAGCPRLRADSRLAGRRGRRTFIHANAPASDG
ncbi:type IV secretion system protein [Stenotrophomonas indicatrix]|uniref:type IV secretion system protein n=1 Tax=Stenotrophomonas indicatrix TaxID=2045451 RepID=UPI003CE59CA5